MARKYGRCANYAECTLADSHKVIDSSEDNFVCPECGKPLRVAAQAVTEAGKKPVTMLKWFLPLLLLLLIGGGLAAWQVGAFSAGSGNGQAQTASTATVTTPPPAPAPVSVTPPPVAQPTEESSPNIVLRLHGSNTIGAKLAPALVEAFMQDKGYTEIEKLPVADLEVLVKGKKPGATETDAIEIKAHGSSTAFDETDKNAHVGLLGGYADVGMSSSPVKTAAINKFQAKNLGDPSSRAQEHVIALDGLAVIVNPANSVDKLTVDNIRKVFLGEITDWSALGGQAGPIKLYSRDHQSGTYDTFKHLVLSGKKLECETQANLTCFEDSKELSSHVASDPNGIGFIGLNYIGTAKALKVSMAEKVNALAPTRFSVKTEDYPLSRRLFLYQTNQPTPLAAGFIQFALSDAGQKVVSDAGLVGVGIDDADSGQSVSEVDADKQRLLDDPAIPAAYRDLIRDADRKDTQLNFRFQSGSPDLDNRAYRDIGRLAEKLGKPEFDGAQLVLVGFADPQGDPAKNLALSKQRAMQVKDQLESEGLKVKTATGFGEELSLLLDPREEEPESLAKNRRVEVWLQR
ncbi:MAG: phosphate ABC transporter substrate-binding/OmpA family protein [Gammaproteobacteria bacterium]|nr:phosphate ABC transporter substrate-binding/OmpA family protein [Gammaproteobacteria bacterium]MBU1723486.1 phosphate ABC transporter substrate-binding/OmpA family protein [Gammaproteobacteria bacterium]MBU2004224.1 phosphate ABC transporter substrate-binding/OmpA family protein [Gammaproteobacteria bacterium]